MKLKSERKASEINSSYLMDNNMIGFYVVYIHVVFLGV